MKKNFHPAILSFLRGMGPKGNSDLKKAENWDDLTNFTCNL